MKGSHAREPAQSSRTETDRAHALRARGRYQGHAPCTPYVRHRTAPDDAPSTSVTGTRHTAAHARGGRHAIRNACKRWWCMSNLTGCPAFARRAMPLSANVGHGGVCRDQADHRVRNRLKCSGVDSIQGSAWATLSTARLPHRFYEKCTGRTAQNGGRV